MDSWLPGLRIRLLHALGAQADELHPEDGVVDRRGPGPGMTRAGALGRSPHMGGQIRVGAGAPVPGWAPRVRFPVEDLHVDLRRALAAAWTERGREEHASIACFARFTLQLVALGAPARLVGLACAAQADEVRHAQQCFAVASVFGHRTMGPGLVDLRQAMVDQPEPAQVLVDVLRGGAIGETLAAARARAAASECEDEAIASVLEHIAEDEVRHATLGWRTARWLLQRWPELHGIAESELSGMPHFSHRAIPTGAENLGFLTAATEARVIGQTWSAVVEPCIGQLLQPLAVESPAA